MKRIALLVLALGLGCAAAGGVNLLDDADFAGLSRVPESWTTGNARVAVDAARHVAGGRLAPVVHRAPPGPQRPREDALHD